MEHQFDAEEDLQRLIKQSESIRLEFKASALLGEPTDHIVKQLTEEVSAFANTEGGVMIIGIKEGKSGRKSVAIEIDEGTDPTQMQPERLEQLIASNISPPVAGLVVRPIPLSGAKTGRIAYVVIVPKGSTAHQATKTLHYYGRTEFAATRLHDNVIRLLMMRGRTAHAVIEMGEVTRTSAEDEFEERQVSLREERKDGMIIRAARKRILEAPKRANDLYRFSLSIRNDGGVTIRNCMLAVSVVAPFEVLANNHRLGTEYHVLDFPAGNDLNRVGYGGALGAVHETKIEARLFPEQATIFPYVNFTAHPPAGATRLRATLEWRLYLDDAPMTFGSINLGRELTTRASPSAQKRKRR